jgi:hypothetical protein
MSGVAGLLGTLHNQLRAGGLASELDKPAIDYSNKVVYDIGFLKQFAHHNSELPEGLKRWEADPTPETEKPKRERKPSSTDVRGSPNAMQVFPTSGAFCWVQSCLSTHVTFICTLIICTLIISTLIMCPCLFAARLLRPRCHLYQQTAPPLLLSCLRRRPRRRLHQGPRHPLPRAVARIGVRRARLHGQKSSPRRSRLRQRQWQCRRQPCFHPLHL